MRHDVAVRRLSQHARGLILRLGLRRLARAGFIKLYALSPSVNLVDMDSLWAHLENVSEDRDFWDRDGDNFRHYCHVNGLDEQAQARMAGE